MLSGLGLRLFFGLALTSDSPLPLSLDDGDGGGASSLDRLLALRGPWVPPSNTASDSDPAMV